MNDIYTCLGVGVWFAGCVLLCAMYFPFHPRTAKKLIERRCAAVALAIVWLMIGVQLYGHFG